MKKLLVLISLFISINSNAQFLKEVYNDFLKYGTFYVAGNIGNAKLENSSYFIRTDPDNLYAIPTVIDETTYHPFNYRYGIGFRKLARFDYEVKSKNYYNGTENNKALSAPTSAVKGLEYLFHWERERRNGDEFTNRRLFIRHTGKYHIVKFENRESGNVGFKYSSGEVRGRLPIGKKFSLSAGAIYRTHETPYGYNPIALWLNTKNDNGHALNPWYTLGFEYGYTDHYTSYTTNGKTSHDWIWKDSDGEIVAYGDRDFRDRVFGDLMNRYNKEAWADIDPFGEIAPIVGFDFYHYRSNFWVHGYGNYILPYHKYIKGDEAYSYLHRNCWKIDGYDPAKDGQQWSDYQAGLMFGWKISKSLGVFVEGEYTKFWDKEIFSSNIGINITFR